MGPFHPCHSIETMFVETWQLYTAQQADMMMFHGAIPFLSLHPQNHVCRNMAVVHRSATRHEDVVWATSIFCQFFLFKSMPVKILFKQYSYKNKLTL
ncbi:hypothetical protein C0J52_18025 [Blattella germanica]|nr:hypothetical protein C0J52_18025 [Blattella germanica]